ncbi:VOC family protein [Tersicoccus sp. Bi-70]|uniref:VOC family protein n=1 Tax=Tersicoccus sp. Bi-70 TaxID=1897634 RepID=UPI00097680FB|nr:VOC family protein [Tersicoccus sp. Bi-70]OMH36609.1 glyoxalase [Tersicoccus sp. Bi-70]
MDLRWYSIVIDSRDIAAQARWWAEVLNWQVVFESDEEAVIIPRWSEEEMAATPFDRVGPGLVFVPVPEEKVGKNRLHLDLAPHTSLDRQEQADRLLALGATRADVGQGPDVTWDVFRDPEGNEFCLLSSRDR